MAMALSFSIVIILFSYMIPTALLCLLQYFLSKMESPWPGRVLPILSGCSTLITMVFLLLNAVRFVHAERMWGMILMVVLFQSIPTVVFIVIYCRTRRNLITKKNMEKMSIQDLE